MTVDLLRELMITMYPDDDSESEYPMTAVGAVLLTAGLFGITEEEALVRFTGYPRSFTRSTPVIYWNNRKLS